MKNKNRNIIVITMITTTEKYFPSQPKQRRYPSIAFAP